MVLPSKAPKTISFKEWVPASNLLCAVKKASISVKENAIKLSVKNQIIKTTDVARALCPLIIPPLKGVPLLNIDFKVITRINIKNKLIKIK